KWRVVDSSKRFHRDVSFSLALATWAAGQTVRCRCGDPACNGQMPWGLVGSPHLNAWAQAHPWLNEVETDDRDHDVAADAHTIRELMQLLDVAIHAQQHAEALGRADQI